MNHLIVEKRLKGVARRELLKLTPVAGPAWLMGGLHLTRIWYFAAMCDFLAFVPGHLIMVLLHGWQNSFSMPSGWKKDPEYLR